VKTEVKRPTESEVTISATADAGDLESVVRSTYNQLRQQVKAAGFRPGKAPDNIVEKELGEQRVQAEVIEAAAAKIYERVIRENSLAPIANPHVEIKKFVPFKELQLEFKVDVIPEIKLADYTKFKIKKVEVKIDPKEVDEVIKGLQLRLAKRKEVKRAAKAGDEITLDFEGSKNQQPVPGAKAQDYNLVLGSDRFVPGFEKSLIGAKAGDQPEFDVTFPKDYPEASLQNQKVHFKTRVKKVSQLELPKVDDKFAQQVGPFKDLAKLKADITKQISLEKEQAARAQLENQILERLRKETKLSLPPKMVDEEVERLMHELKHSLEERGGNFEDYLKERKIDEAAVKSELAIEAKNRVENALLISTVAKDENIKVTPEELEIRLQLMGGQYRDPKIKAELEKAETKQRVTNQLLAEKTLQQLVQKASI
jgi:trigger factor